MLDLCLQQGADADIATRRAIMIIKGKRSKGQRIMEKKKQTSAVIKELSFSILIVLAGITRLPAPPSPAAGEEANSCGVIGRIRKRSPAILLAIPPGVDVSSILRMFVVGRVTAEVCCCEKGVVVGEEAICEAIREGVVDAPKIGASELLVVATGACGENWFGWEFYEWVSLNVRHYVGYSRRL